MFREPKRAHHSGETSHLSHDRLCTTSGGADVAFARPKRMIWSGLSALRSRSRQRARTSTPHMQVATRASAKYRMEWERACMVAKECRESKIGNRGSGNRGSKVEGPA